MRKRKLRRRIERAFGKVPDIEYFEGDMTGIKAYYDYRLEQGLDNFLIDDITWHDLSMDQVFKRVNAAQSISGEQYLYYTLRSPAVEEGVYRNREALIGHMEAHPTLRLNLQMILARLGKYRMMNTVEAFRPSVRVSRIAVFSLLLLLGMLLCFAGMFFTKAFVSPFFAFLIGIPIFHTIVTEKYKYDLSTVNYTVGMVKAAYRIRKLNDPSLMALLAPLEEASRKARPVRRMGGVSFAASSDIMDVLNIFFLTDLIAYARLKHLLVRHKEEVFAIHEALGKLDTAISIASYRRSVADWCRPAIHFAPDAPRRFVAEGLVHPLLKDPVPNSIETDAPLLVTGSNASGKSTFIKAALVNALLAQSICTAHCKAYSAPAFHIYSSIAVSDDIMRGDSYFIAELKSVKRISEAVRRGERILCVIDEVLRGTNTVERIAASSELLRALAEDGALCFAATHDGELCAMLSPPYRLIHFAERIEGNEVLFDYLVKDGPATTRNALKLLSILGFEAGMVERASDKARRYLEKGTWES